MLNFRSGLSQPLFLIAASLTACATPATRGGPASEPVFTGTWVGPLPIGATDTRDFAVQVHERADGSLMGYVFGGTSKRTVLAGSRSGDTLALVFALEDSGLTRSIFLGGDVTGDTLSGTANSDTASTPVTWRRRSGPLQERKYIFIDPARSDALTEVAVVLDSAGNVVSGGFVSDTCDLIACGGGVTGLTETSGGALTISVETGGSCRGTGAITAIFDPSRKFYDGSWTMTDDGGCGGAIKTGLLIGGRDMGTNTGDAASILASLGALADDLEAGTMIAAPYGPVASSYRHFGETAAALIASLNSETTAHPGAEVVFGGFQSLRTIAPAGLNPFLSDRPRVAFNDVRTDASGIYHKFEAGTPGQGRLSFIGDVGDAWRLIGNQVGEFDLPFDYTMGTEHLAVPAGTGATAGTLHLSLSGWGTHFTPLTGHIEGNGKADMSAHYAATAAELTQRANGPGGTPDLCDVDLVRAGTGEICGFYGGPSGEIIRDRMFTYKAPYDGEVLEILYEERPRSAADRHTHYFDNPPHWSVRIAFEGGLTIRFVHLGQLTGAVRDGLIATTGIDPDTYAPPSTPGDPDFCPPSPGRCNVDVLGGARFSISAGDEIAKAQTDAAPVDGHLGYFKGQIGVSIAPWAQVEFFVTEEIGDARAANVCAYQYLPEAKQTAMAALMTADMLNPLSLRYAENDFVRPWKFRSEALLCNNDGYFIRDENDFGSIHAQLGGWYEHAGARITANEQFTIAKIHKTAAAYGPMLHGNIPGSFDKPDYLITRDRTDDAAFNWTLPGAGPTTVRSPTGEVLTLTPGGFTVKWRELGGPSGAGTFQRAAYELDPATGLKIKWGALAATFEGAAVPTLWPSDACNDTDVTCYGHTRP